MFPVIKTYAEIVQQMMLSAVTNVTGITNVNIIGVTRTIFEAVAEPISELYEYASDMLKQRYIDTATGTWLDRIGKEYDTLRNESIATQGYVKISRPVATSALAIPVDSIVGTDFDTNGFRYTYKVAASTYFAIGEFDKYVLISAVQEGSGYNVETGFIDQVISGVVGVTVTNESGWITVEGADEEEDEAYRARLLLVWATLSRGSIIAAYESWAMNSNSAVKSANARVSKTVPGQVDITITSQSGVPSAALIGVVQTYINLRKPVSVTVVVQAPSVVTLNPEVNIIPVNAYSELVGTDYDAAILALQTTIENAISDYIDTFGVGQDFVFSKFVTMLSLLDDVYSVTVLTPSADSVIGSYSLAEAGTITVNMMEPSDE